MVLTGGLIAPAAGAASLAGALAPPAAVRARVDGPATIEAGGQAGPLHIVLAGLDGTPVPRGTTVRAVIVSGDARLADGLSADLTTDAASSVTLIVQPGTQSGALIVRLDVGSASVDVPLTLTADARKPLVVGFATGGIGPVPGLTDFADGAPDGTTARRGAASLFGTGEIARNTRGTFAYDSSNTLQQTLQADPFLDNPNDRPFPIYGDASIRHDDALSTNHYYASIQNGRSSAMYGEFFAQAGAPSAVGGYNVLVNGARITAGGNTAGVGAFTARNDTAYARAVISPTGLAIANQALHPDIVVGSDVLTLVHLDRRTGAVLAQTVLARGSDYVLDYASGQLRFVNIILPYDDAFNPQVVMAQYEYGGPGATSTMLGAKSSLALNHATRADGWYLNDAIGSGNLTLLGQSLGGASPNTTWSASHERSQGSLPTAAGAYGAGGDAYHASITARTPAVKISVAFAAVDAAYQNPFGSYTAPGLVSLDAAVAVRLGRISELEVKYFDSRNELPATTTTQAVANADLQAALILRVKPSARLTYHAGIEDDAATSNGVVNPLLFADGPALGTTANAGSVLPDFRPVAYTAGSGHVLAANVGIDWRFTQRASIGVTRVQPFGSSSDPYDPPSTQAEFDLAVGANGKLFVRQLWQQSASQNLAATQTVQTAAATAQSQTSIGFEQQVGSTTYQSGYAVDHTANGTDLFDAIGVRTKILASPRLNADGFVQVGNSLYSTYGTPGANPFFVTAGTSLDYALRTFHASGQVQVRAGFDSGSTLQLGAAGPISPDVSLFGSYTASYTQAVEDSEGRGGLAFRPSRNDRYVTLFSIDAYKSNLTNYDAYVTNVAQLQELYRPGRRTELAASAAYKLTGDAFFAPRTTIFGVRADQKIGSRFDVGGEGHWSDVAPLAGVSATGFALEAGYRLGSSLRAAAGYNFSGFADPDTAISPTHRGVYLTMSTYVDRIFGWGKTTGQGTAPAPLEH